MRLKDAASSSFDCFNIDLKERHDDTVSSIGLQRTVHLWGSRAEQEQLAFGDPGWRVGCVTVRPFGEGAEVKISPIPCSVMVHARSIVASRIGAAGYKLMRSLVRDMELIARPALGTQT